MLLSRSGLFVPTWGQVRGMATLKDIRMRLKAVTNIQKITKSMKMVSAAKYARAERDLRLGRPYGVGAQAFYQQAEVKDDAKDTKPKTLLVAISSDRGLCGGIHSSVAKSIKAYIAESDLEQTRIICVGDKVRGILARLFAKNILTHFADVGKKPPTFKDASTVAKTIINCGYEYDRGLLVFNRFKTVVSYTTMHIPIYTAAAVSNASKISVYDSLDSEVLNSYLEYSLASLIYYTMKENACSEQSARMTAMDGATKNAGEMIDKLTLTFNRTRQAVITRELIEIISGAAAL